MARNFSMQKLYYSISEVSRIAELEQYVLRYWETEFEQLRPAKNHSGNRIYTNKDIKLILYIKKLLREEKYTIEGAKKLIKNYSAKEEAQEVVKNQPVSESNSKSGTSAPGELSLFNNEKNSIPESEPRNKKDLEKDLVEVKSFLINLLDEID
ncbi:MAG: MerR family transcriptional regulator [Ignavibacteria bacterium]|nr:MerR family transcriptional regulator [Ignavibacteria bacterium]